MLNLLIILGEILIVFVAIGVAGCLALLACHLYGSRIASQVAREVPSPELADVMVGRGKRCEPVLPDDLTDRQVDRLARHLEIQIVDPAPPVILLDGTSSSLTPAGREGDREASSHAERGRR